MHPSGSPHIGGTRDCLGSTDSGPQRLGTVTNRSAWAGWIGYVRAMSTEAVRRLHDSESGAVWDRFDDEFDFRPSIYEFPGIAEPVGSSTWDLGAIRDEPGEQLLDRYEQILLSGLSASAAPGMELLVLDWQHTCYAVRPDLPTSDMFLPHAIGKPHLAGWPLSPYPNGDYCIYLASDFALGSFGHPWEQTVCVFGKRLLARVAAPLDELLGPAIRRDGLATGPAPARPKAG